MKKYSYILSALFFIAAMACTEKEPVMTTLEEGEGTVTFDMEVTIPESAILTRAACGDNPSIENIYVATFGSRGYLNEYVKAIPVDADGNVISTYATTNSPDKYHLRVTLLATTSRRYVHIIANGPESVDYETKDTDLMLTKIMSTGYKNGVPQGAYWQYFELPNGTSEWKNGKWVEGTDAKDKFGSIKLIRNFARVTVKSTASNFTLDPDAGFYVFRTESEGSIAMPTSPDGLANFVDANRYAAISQTDPLTSIAALPYSGFTPEGVELHAPDAKDNGVDGITYNKPGDYQYVYESLRSYDTEEEPFIIIRGKLDTDDDFSYYRIELTDENAKFYSIYRNVDYTITITAAARSIVGSATASGARTCNGNVSTAVSATLPELSDGFQGLYVLYTDKTVVNTDKSGDEFVNKEVSFMYKYVKDVVGDPDTGSQASLSIQSSGGQGHAIANTTGTWYSQTGPDADGWYTVKFNVLPSATYTSEASTVFRVTGTTEVAGVQQSIFRNITVRLIPIQTFKNIKVTKVDGGGTTAGTTVDISFSLEDNLPKSMFPLKITVQDSELALNPVGTDMPLVVHSDGVNYHFYKSVSYRDYQQSKTVTCHMKLIQDMQASSLKINVANEYFTPVELSYTGS